MVTRKEKDAIIAFLEQSKSAKEAQRRLFARTAEEPEPVMEFLDTLPARQIAGDELLLTLRAIATAALKAKAKRE